MNIEGPLKESDYAFYCPDDPAQTRPDKVYYLAMFSLYLDQHVWGLALRRLASGPNMGYYERVGIFDVYEEDYDSYYGASKTMITIV